MVVNQKHMPRIYPLRHVKYRQGYFLPISKIIFQRTIDHISDNLYIDKHKKIDANDTS